MSKTFDVAGVSTKNGMVKFRVANGKPEARAKVLEKDGHTNIDLFQLAKPMTKEQVFALLASKGYKESKEVAAKPAKPAKLAKTKPAPKLKVVKTKPVAKTKEVPAAEILEDVGITVTNDAPVAAAPSTNSINEIARIKAKNLETMRQVTNRFRALREFN